MISRSDAFRMLSCDDVFDVLTRAPFPSGDQAVDAAVELHVRCCHDCRSLAEALRPATNELSETLPAESSCLPQVDGNYWQNAQADWRNTPVHPSHSSSPWLNVAVPMLAVLVAMLVLATYWGSRDQKSPSGFEGRSLANVQYEAERYLVNLSLPAACQSLRHARSTEMVAQAAVPQNALSLAKLTCCSECHHHDSALHQAPATSSPAAVVAAANSCQACHTP